MTGIAVEIIVKETVGIIRENVMMVPVVVANRLLSRGQVTPRNKNYEVI